MHDPRSRPRTALMVGTAFLAGVAIGPTSGLIARHVGLGFVVNGAFAQTRACHQLAGFGRWAPSAYRIRPVSPDCHTRPSIGTG